MTNKQNHKMFLSILKSVASSRIKKKDIVFEVTGTNIDGEEGIYTYMNGNMDNLEELMTYFHDTIVSGSLWLTNVRRDQTLGKRILICRKGDKYVASK